MSRLILVRHTKPDVPQGLCYGHSDVPCERQDFADWRYRGAWPSSFQAYSSPLSRCRDLALRHCPGPICLDDRLKELNFGRWDGLLWDQIPREVSEAWMKDYLRLAPPEGETLGDLVCRLQGFVISLPADEQTRIVFSHAGVIRVLLLAAFQEPLANYFTREVSYGSIWELPRIPTHSDFEHLLSSRQTSS